MCLFLLMLVVLAGGAFGAATSNNELLTVFVPKTILPKPPVKRISISEYEKWLSFQHGPESPQTPFARLQITSTSPSLLLMTSYVLPGAFFSFQLDNTPLQSTTMPHPSSSTITSVVLDDPQEAFDRGYFGHAMLVLNIGPHYLDVRVTKSPFGNGLMAVKLVRLQIDPRYHVDYFMVQTPVPVSLANRTCQAFASKLAHLSDQKQLMQVVKLFSSDTQTFYIGGFGERMYDGSPLVVVPGKKIKVSEDTWNHKQAMVLCYRRYPPQQ